MHGFSSMLAVVMNLLPNLELTTMTRTPKTSSKTGISLRLAGLSSGTPANRLKALAKSVCSFHPC